jgi:multidrug efflux pump subunit AcrA (membrane-fusion protein)
LANCHFSINESGILKLAGQQNLSSPTDGAVESVTVKIGDPVKVGRVLVTLRNSDTKNLIPKKRLEIQNKELSLSSNRQKLAETARKLATAKQELQADRGIGLQKQQWVLTLARQKVVEAMEKIEAEQQQLQELEDLDRRGFIAKDELKAQQVKIRIAKSAWSDARSNVVTANLDLQNLHQQLQEKVLEAQSTWTSSPDDGNWC